MDPGLIGKMKLALGWDTTDKQATAVLGRLDDARMGELLSAWSSPFVRFEYRDRSGYMPFERASPGQQASALLALLLEQEAGTLIIDQPEDDLDNKIIMRIARLLQTTKRKRQLIFATHNPNFVVNGDADKVMALTPSVEPDSPADSQAARIEIEADGAIETPTVRTTITDTMEGGRDAFELRGRKYAF
jgi:ATPase subunit of ABC transporter with duplicated ATPase domains